MKKLLDYKDTKTYVVCKTKKEFEKLIPKLNCMFHGWSMSAWSPGVINYIDMETDCMEDGFRAEKIKSLKEDGYEFIPAAEFLVKNKVINDYSVW